MLYRRRNTLIKEYILLSLQIITTIIKIKAETTTKTTKIITKIIKTLAIIKYTDNQRLTANLRDIAISAKKKLSFIKIYKRGI